MKQLLVLLSSALLLNACSKFPLRQTTPDADAAAAAVRKPAQAPTLSSDGTARTIFNGVEIEKVEFRAGVSSATVENLAKRQSCTGGVGAGLVTKPGPAEVYRMVCDNGKVFMARCELRQCKPM